MSEQLNPYDLSAMRKAANRNKREAVEPLPPKPTESDAPHSLGHEYEPKVDATTAAIYGSELAGDALHCRHCGKPYRECRTPATSKSENAPHSELACGHGKFDAKYDCIECLRAAVTELNRRASVSLQRQTLMEAELSWIVAQEDYTFAECSLAEEIMERVKRALVTSKSENAPHPTAPKCPKCNEELRGGMCASPDCSYEAKIEAIAFGGDSRDFISPNPNRVELLESIVRELAEYARHAPICAKGGRIGGKENECDCGLEELQRRVEGVLAQ